MTSRRIPGIEGVKVACPFFLPTEKFDMGPHSSRLPLGAGWEGRCTAGQENVRPSDHDLREFCNFGYARRCSRLPQVRPCDAVRFAVMRDRDDKVTLCFVCEMDYRPGEHGALQFDVAAGTWTTLHADTRVQKMAQCYLESYLERRGRR